MRSARRAGWIDAQFPPYEQVIPREHKKIITIDRMRLIDALRRRRAQPEDGDARAARADALREAQAAKRSAGGVV